MGPGDRCPAAADGGRPQRAVRAAGECGAAGRWGGGCTAPPDVLQLLAQRARGRAGDKQMGVWGKESTGCWDPVGARSRPEPLVGSGNVVRSPRSRGLRAALGAAAPISRAIYSR